VYFLSWAGLGHSPTYRTGDFQRFFIVEGWLEYNLKSLIVHPFNMLNLLTQYIERIIIIKTKPDVDRLSIILHVKVYRLKQGTLWQGKKI